MAKPTFRDRFGHVIAFLLTVTCATLGVAGVLKVRAALFLGALTHFGPAEFRLADMAGWIVLGMWDYRLQLT